jgi:hypothetical protein
MDRDKKSLVLTYLIPVAVGLLLPVLGYLLGFLELKNIVFATLIVFVIGLAIYLSELWLTESSRLTEREESFRLLTTLLFSERQTVSGQHLSMPEILAIEQTAKEVWIYAYDLKWEDGDSSLPDAVHDNLKRGVRYRYVIPNNPRVIVRAKNLLSKYVDVPDLDKLIEFRARTHEHKLVQFGIGVFNPTAGTSAHGNSNECVAVFYPHYDGLGPNTREGRQFLSMRGKSTVEIQEGFIEAWGESTPITATRKPAPRIDCALSLANGQQRKEDCNV